MAFFDEPEWLRLTVIDPRRQIDGELCRRPAERDEQKVRHDRDEIDRQEGALEPVHDPFGLLNVPVIVPCGGPDICVRLRKNRSRAAGQRAC